MVLDSRGAVSICDFWGGDRVRKEEGGWIVGRILFPESDGVTVWPLAWEMRKKWKCDRQMNGEKRVVVCL